MKCQRIRSDDLNLNLCQGELYPDLSGFVLKQVSYITQSEIDIFIIQ
ncbi:MAG: hypothetical protein HKO99_01465 [Xanthomonadales bacterium]|nr:hypothetical protein [Xanthomonadales bacterium]